MKLLILSTIIVSLETLVLVTNVAARIIGE
jgi:hypothetical protein